MCASSWGTDPVGSTKIWSREFEAVLDPKTSVCEDDGTCPRPRDPDDEEVVPNAVRLVDDSGAGGGGIAMLDIIRF